MLKHLMSGSSLLALALRDADDEAGAEDAKARLRAKIAGDVSVTAKSENETAPPKKEDDEGEEDEDSEEDSEEDDEENEDEEAEAKKKEEELTPEQIKEKEAADKIAAKAKRKDDRMQKRINDATARNKVALEEIANLKAQLAADPDKKLTPEEVETRANAIAQQKINQKELEEVQAKFDKACETLAKAAKKIDPEFDDNVTDMAEQFGPIPSFMIGVLEDFENGGEVLAYLAKDDDEAERIYDLKRNPAKMTKELVLISNKLADAKKPPRKQISRVPDPPTAISNGRSQSLVITEADTKDMAKYTAKRIRQREEQKKARGY